MTIDWNGQLVDQLEFHWQHHARPRLDDLTDEEYLWEPVAGCWNVRRHGDRFVMDREQPEPNPPPVTTIAWRMGHLVVDVFGKRLADHFAGPPCRAGDFAHAGTAGEALQQLDSAYAAWLKGIRELGQEGLARPCGPAEGPFAAYPMAALVLHIHREVIHHAAEILVLRDLYRNRE